MKKKNIEIHIIVHYNDKDAIGKAALFSLQSLISKNDFMHHINREGDTKMRVNAFETNAG